MKNLGDCQFEELPQELPKGHKLALTADGSPTLWSAKFDENCHSLAGAYGETLYNYYHGCNISEKLLTVNTLNILDVGFGPGLGLKVLRDELFKIAPSARPKLNYISVELEPELVLWAEKYTLAHNSPPDSLLKFSPGGNEYIAQDLLGSYRVLIGDARVQLPKAQLEENFPPLHAIFQDAFSPKKNPVLWTQEWFELLKACADPSVILSTYSASTAIRKSLHCAGWHVNTRKGFGEKRACTQAKLLMTPGSIQSDRDRELEKMLLNPKVMPLRDADLKL